MRNLVCLSIILLIPLVQLPEAYAQSSTSRQAFNTKGLFVNVHASGTGMQVVEDETDSGAGLGASVGYGINKTATLYVKGHVSDMSVEDEATLRRVADENYDLAHFDLGVRLNKGISQRGALYGGVALGGVASSYDARTVATDAVLRGFSVTGEAGFMYFVAPRVALDIGLNLSAGRHSTLDAEGRTESVELDTRSARINAGISIYPFRE